MPRRKRRRRKSASSVPEVTCPECAADVLVDLPEHLVVDQLIRRLGFRIHSRKGPDPWWHRDGSTYSQQEILARYVSEEELWEAEYRVMMESALAEFERDEALP